MLDEAASYITMSVKKDHSSRRASLKKGGGIVTSALSTLGKTLAKIPVGTVVNKLVDALPLELHLPAFPGSYQYCGPGTKLAKRLARGDPGINGLDKACKEHDIAYSKSSDTASRSVADNILASKAWQRFKSSDASLGERAAALAVAAAMKTKSAVGGRINKRRKRGGNIRRKRRNTKSKKKNSSTLGRWKVTTTGRGLYLRPYRNA